MRARLSCWLSCRKYGWGPPSADAPVICAIGRSASYIEASPERDSGDASLSVQAPLRRLMHQGLDMRLKRWQWDLVLFILASPFLLIEGLLGLWRRLRVWRLTQAPATPI